LAGAFGSWKTGESHNWHEVRAKPPTPEERAALRKHLQAAQAARVVEQGRVHAEAQAKAARLWGQARPATNVHPYLQRKRIGAIGIRQLRDMLLIPARDANGTLHTLQFISPDGSKRFLSGGRIAGCYYAMGRPVGSVLLCEGYSTAATVFQATGEATAVAFNAGNLPTVARALRAKFPRLRIVVCADNDAATPGNPGLTKATEAARAVGGFVAVPRFEGVRHGV
jgi:putative DNA primase/helicase